MEAISWMATAIGHDSMHMWAWSNGYPPGAEGTVNQKIHEIVATAFQIQIARVIGASDHITEYLNQTFVEWVNR